MTFLKIDKNTSLLKIPQCLPISPIIKSKCLVTPGGSGLWYLSTSSVTLFCDHGDFPVGHPQGFMMCRSLWPECAYCRLAYIPVHPPSCYLGFSSDIFLTVVYLWLCWVSVAAGLFSSCSPQASHGCGFPCCGAQSLRHLGFNSFSSRTLEHSLNSQPPPVAHGFSCSWACGIFPDQGLKLCLLHWQVNSLPLSHQGRPSPDILI